MGGWEKYQLVTVGVWECGKFQNRGILGLSLHGMDGEITAMIMIFAEAINLFMVMVISPSKVCVLVYIDRCGQARVGLGRAAQMSLDVSRA